MREIRHQVFAVEHLRSDRHPHLDGLAVRAVLARAAAVTALRRRDQPAALQPREIAEILVRNGDHVAAVPTVAAVGTAFRHVLLAAKRQCPVAAATRLYLEPSVVAEHSCTSVGSTELK